MASTLLPSCPIPEIGEEFLFKTFLFADLNQKKLILYEGEKDKVVFDICLPQIQESAESRHL